LVSAVQDAIDPTRAAAAAAKGSGRRVAGPELPKAAQAYHLLVAEDQEVNQIVARELLTEAGYRCDVVGDGAAAVRAAAAERYDLVLMDCQMPTMDGFEATQRIRASESQSPARRRLPIIALTANASGADRGRCMAAGMDGYCGKPFEPLELLTMIGGFLSGKAPAAPPTPPAPQEPAEGPFNLTKLLRQCSGKPALAAMVLEKFDAQTADTLVQLRRVAADLDMSGVARLSHALKGTAGVIAADGLWQAAARLEALGRAGDAALLDQTLRELCNEAERCRAHVEQTKAQFTPAAARVEERT
jgi:CheY-like chemotaxis protein/HPt (histidine-containing phosphotransfer) domain-containing protein